MYLINAIFLAKQNNKRAHVALFQEVDVSHPDLPGIGPISGALDYLSSTTQKLSIRDFGETATPDVPHFIVVEAKRASTLGDTAASAQLYAQLLTLDYMDK
jgi:hypothetical protein